MKTETDPAPNVIHNDIHGNTGPIFCGVVNQPVFMQPGANYTPHITNNNTAADPPPAPPVPCGSPAGKNTAPAPPVPCGSPAGKNAAPAPPVPCGSPAGKNTPAETPEEKAVRRQRTLAAITPLFQFDAKTLGRDSLGRPVTNGRLASLFRRSLGQGAHPGRQQQQVIDGLWTLLADKRNQCTRQPGETYFRQTVLNILGYYREKAIIHGTPLALARSVFADAAGSLAKNIERGITSNAFPPGTPAWLDVNIARLMAGEI